MAEGQHTQDFNREDMELWDESAFNSIISK